MKHNNFPIGEVAFFCHFWHDAFSKKNHGPFLWQLEQKTFLIFFLDYTVLIQFSVFNIYTAAKSQVMRWPTQSSALVKAMSRWKYALPWHTNLPSSPSSCQQPRKGEYRRAALVKRTQILAAILLMSIVSVNCIL